MITSVGSGLPNGEVTLLFTDVEGSTALLHEVGPERYADLLTAHRRLLRQAFAAGGGTEVDTQGDAFFVAFPSASAAVLAAAAAQTALSEGPIRVRMGLHTGRPHLAAEGYVGEDVHLGARIAAAGHGGQVLLSAATWSLVEADGTDLGEHRLKDFDEPVRIFQLGRARFPVLKTISNTNLPRPVSSFVGREREVEAIVAALRRPARLVTLTGPGGTGKTRVAIEAATELIPEFKAGVFWVGLATLQEPDLVLQEMGAVLGAQSDLAAAIGERQMLLLLDNFEQVVEAAPRLSPLLRTCPNLSLLVTSRTLLRIDGEVEYSVPPLSRVEAASLFATRAGVEAGPIVTELCRRLDDLPLAVELAAARARVLSPAAILDRLAQRLDLLKGGRDADPRQQTLRATIAWSHDLLGEREQRSFARLSVFAGGCTLDAAEAVTDADIDTLQSLVQQSLVRRTEDRFWMLETIREFAAERFSEPDVARRHIEYYVALAETAWDEGNLRPEEWLDRLEVEHDNFRAVLDRLEADAEVEQALQLAGALSRFWARRGHFSEGRARLERLLAQDARPSPVRARALNGAVALAVGRNDAESAWHHGKEALALHRVLRDDQGIAFTLFQLGVVATEREDFQTGLRLTAESVELLRSAGDEFTARQALINLGYVHQTVDQFAESRAVLERALRESREAGVAVHQAGALGQLAVGARSEGRHDEALRLLDESLEIWASIGDPAMIARELRRVAYSLAKLGRAEPAARILAASETVRENAGHDESWIRNINEEILADLHEQLDAAAFERAWLDGRALTLEEAVALGRSVARSNGAPAAVERGSF